MFGANFPSLSVDLHNTKRSQIAADDTTLRNSGLEIQLSVDHTGGHRQD